MIRNVSSIIINIICTLQKAMDVVGIPPDIKEEIKSLIAAVLHIGNIQFSEEGNYAKVHNSDCKCT